MKTFRLMMISILFVAITTISGVVGEGTDVVYCEEGEPLRTNVPYYISFMTTEYDMWIHRMNAETHDSSSCPLQPIMFTHHPAIAATPVIFLLKSNSAPNVTIRESDEIHIKFVNSRRCGESGFWRVFRNSTRLEGEVLLNGSRSSKRNDSTFTIHKTNEFFKFSFPPYPEDIEYSDYPMSISITNEQVYNKLLAKRYSGEMEILFHRTRPY